MSKLLPGTTGSAADAERHFDAGYDSPGVFAVAPPSRLDVVVAEALTKLETTPLVPETGRKFAVIGLGSKLFGVRKTRQPSANQERELSIAVRRATDPRYSVAKSADRDAIYFLVYTEPKPYGTPPDKQAKYAREGYLAAQAGEFPTASPYFGAYAWEPKDKPAACWYRGYWFYVQVVKPWGLYLSGQPIR